MKSNKAKEVADLVLKKFIESLDEHGTDWQKGWITTGSSGFIPVNGVTGAEYSGSNVFTLMALGAGCGFESNKCGTNRCERDYCRIRTNDCGGSSRC